MRGSERFTQRASTAITKAHDAAMGMGHSYVGTEHLLLGIIREGELVFQDTLEALHQHSRHNLTLRTRDNEGALKLLHQNRVPCGARRAGFAGR